MGATAEGTEVDSENASELEGEGEPVAQLYGNHDYYLMVRDLMMKTTKKRGKLEKRGLGNTRRGG